MKTWARLSSCSVKGELTNLYIRQVRIPSVLHRKHHLAVKKYFRSRKEKGPVNIQRQIRKSKYVR